MIFTIRKGTVFPLGGHAVTLDKGAPFDFTDAPNVDAVAEMLAGASPQTYGLHLESLSHDEEVERGGTMKHVHVTYGAGGVRQEEVFDLVVEEEEKTKKKGK